MCEVVNVVLSCTDFEGRIPRRTYWLFVFFFWLLYLSLVVVDNMIGTWNDEVELGWVSGLYAVIMLLPSTSALVRRLHDTGRSGWWALGSAVPVVSWFVLVYSIQASQLDENPWGSPSVRASAAPAIGD